MASGINVGGWKWDPGQIDESLGGMIREHLEGFETVTVGESEDQYTLPVRRKYILLCVMLEAATGGNAEAQQLAREYLFRLLL